MASSTPLKRTASDASIGSDILVGKRPMANDADSDQSRASSPLSRISSRSPTPVASSMTSYDTKKDAPGSRNVSGLTGATLIDEDGSQSEKRPLKKRRVRETYPEELPPRVARRGSVRNAVKKVAGRVKSVLGKRSRGATKVLRQLDTGAGGLLEELDLDAEDEQPAKRSKRSDGTARLVKAPPAHTEEPKKAAGKLGTRKGKLWLESGLFAGQPSSADSSKKKATETAATRSFMPLPMFGFLDHNKDFTIPFDVFAPSFKKGDEKPKDWHQLNRNRLVGEAKELWEKDAPLARSLCICQPPTNHHLGCDEDCLNRLMHYECDDNNCGLPASQCSNRAFTNLSKRTKKGGPFDVGVEVVKTPNRGFGVRACREFAPGEIVMEYTGEIISEAECQRRMHELYAGKHCYYIMEFDQGFHIDGTKGSMARFVNHSCEPNCEVRMVKVSGTPRMAIFAGERGVFTGEELTYDYNFDNFSDNKQACYCGAPTCRGHLARRLNAAEQKVRDREDRERQLEAEEEARRLAAEQDREKQTKAKRGSGWRGWVTLSEIKEDLKQEKAARAEAEKHSSRAQRLAARHSGVPTTINKRASIVKKRASLKPQADDSTRNSAEQAADPANDFKRSFSLTSKTGQSKFSEHLSADDEVTSLLTDSIARVEAIEQALQADAEDHPESKKTGLIKTTTVKASNVGKTVLKTVEKAVIDSIKQGKVKVMRQSTLSFTNAA